MSEDFGPMIGAIGQEFPALQPHLNNLVVQRAQANPSDQRQLEFYPPWERDNPNPGKITTEIFNHNLQGRDLHEAVAGDMLHHLGSVDPSTGQPIDPAWFAMKQGLINARGKFQDGIDRSAHQQEPNAPPFDAWMQQNRADAYIRGGIFPNQNPEWQHPEIYTPAQREIIQKMDSYLRGHKLDDNSKED